MRPTRSSRLRVPVGAAVVSIVLAACGGGNDTAGPPSTRAAASDAPAVDGTELADMFREAFASTTPLDGGTFDGATLAGVDALVWFWAPWCTSCRGEAPEVAEIAQRYADRLQVIGVPGRGELDAMQEFVDDTGTGSITHLADLDGDAWSAFGVYGQPAYAFVDDAGDIEVFVGGMGGNALAERIDDLLAA